MIAVLGTLFLGLFSMVKGPEFSQKHSNKLMRWRIYIQGLAIALFALAYFASRF